MVIAVNKTCVFKRKDFGKSGKSVRIYRTSVGQHEEYYYVYKARRSSLPWSRVRPQRTFQTYIDAFLDMCKTLNVTEDATI